MWCWMAEEHLTPYQRLFWNSVKDNWNELDDSIYCGILPRGWLWSGLQIINLIVSTTYVFASHIVAVISQINNRSSSIVDDRLVFFFIFFDDNLNFGNWENHDWCCCWFGYCWTCKLDKWCGNWCGLKWNGDAEPFNRWCAADGLVEWWCSNGELPRIGDRIRWCRLVGNIPVLANVDIPNAGLKVPVE